jgi:hypothetical protein
MNHVISVGLKLEIVIFIISSSLITSAKPLDGYRGVGRKLISIG